MVWLVMFRDNIEGWKLIDLVEMSNEVRGNEVV